jgi:hypothetical protein
LPRTEDHEPMTKDVRLWLMARDVYDG